MFLKIYFNIFSGESEERIVKMHDVYTMLALAFPKPD
jgi:hypothetical protein